MSAFSPVTDLASLPLIVEICSALRERRGAPGLSLVPGVPLEGGDAQDSRFWAFIQLIAELTAPYFINHDMAVDGKFGGQSEIPVFDLASFRAAAGLRADGWRRATEYDPDVNDWTDRDDPMFSGGFAQPGDIFGPWIYIDLQRAISALKWSVSGQLPITSEAPGRYAEGNWEQDCSTALVSQGSAWLGSVPFDTPGLLYMIRASLERGENPVFYRASALRYGSRVTLRLAESYLASEVDVYYLMGKEYGTDFRDFDSLGMEDGRLWFHETLSAPRGVDTIQCSLLGGNDVNPIPVSGLSCPIPGTVSNVALSLCYVQKWAFTISN